MIALACLAGAFYVSQQRWPVDLWRAQELLVWGPIGVAGAILLGLDIRRLRDPATYYEVTPELAQDLADLTDHAQALLDADDQDASLAEQTD
ncbi:MAG: hypothetical protein KF861_20175 [Planctomycetaceae bacterium]|nr:hypothetical protein [Planctomycetaceae bacterium]